MPPCWEAKSDWDIFKGIAKSFAALSQRHFPQKVKDVVAMPLMHDTAAEISQPQIRDWHRGDCEPVPGKTMPTL